MRHRATQRSLRTFSWLTAGLGLSFFNVAMTMSAVRAQVVPDVTLPQPSIAIEQDNGFAIQGGTASGTNLFHSFDRFSIPELSRVSFEAIPAETLNVLVRVTGDLASQIDGQLLSESTASFFLINPNGIQFGETAQLALGGSFVATTAERVEFADGLVWSVDDINTDGLLAIDVPLGLQTGAAPGAIVTRSQATSLLFGDTTDPSTLATLATPTTLPPDIAFNPFRRAEVRLEVRPGRSLVLVGGDVSLENSNLTAPSGQIGLVALGSEATVRWQPPNVATGAGFDFDVDLADRLGAIEANIDSVGVGRVLERSFIDVSGLGGGEIRMLGDRIDLRNQLSFAALTLSDRDSRGIELTARGDIRISGTTSVAANTFGAGDSGDIILRAGGDFDLSGIGLESLLPILFIQFSLESEALADAASLGEVLNVSGLNTSSIGQGNAGDVTIAARNLNVRNGGYIFTATGGAGRGGDINLDIAQTATISQSLLQTSTLLGSTGDSGDINIDVEDLTLIDSGSLLGTVLGCGRGSNFNIRVRNAFRMDDTALTPEENAANPGLSLDTGLLVNSLRGGGPAGSIHLQARTIDLDRTGSIASESGSRAPEITGRDRAGPGGNISLVATESIHLIDVNANAISAASDNDSSAGNIQIEAPQLLLASGSGISVANTGSGDAGTLSVRADRLELRDGASLSGTTQAGRSGGIDIRADDLRLDRSSISTNAGSSDGGNIAISTDTLVALANSDITANAVAGLGGQVTIETQGLFGTSIRDRLTPESDITATSALGAEFRGVTTVIEPNLDTTAGVSILPSNLLAVDAVRRTPCGWDAGSTFFVTGRDGLALPPEVVVPLGYTLGDRQERSANRHGIQRDEPQQTTQPVQPQREADRWNRDAAGNLVLQAIAPLTAIEACPSDLPNLHESDLSRYADPSSRPLLLQ